tara:strand:- start:160 stop:390 length:231 start_codon:yes stop_codon:yes gene_type:complete
VEAIRSLNFFNHHFISITSTGRSATRECAFDFEQREGERGAAACELDGLLLPDDLFGPPAAEPTRARRKTLRIHQP